MNNPKPTTSESQRSISLHIDQLVLHGFPPGDRHAIAEAVQRELTRLFSEGGAPPTFAQDINVARVDAGMFNVAADARSDTIGAHVAEAIHKSMNR